MMADGLEDATPCARSAAMAAGARLTRSAGSCAWFPATMAARPSRGHWRRFPLRQASVAGFPVPMAALLPYRAAGAAFVGFDGVRMLHRVRKFGDAVAGCFTVCQVCDDSGKAAPCARPLADVAKSVITP